MAFVVAELTLGTDEMAFVVAELTIWFVEMEHSGSIHATLNL